MSSSLSSPSSPSSPSLPSPAPLRPKRRRDTCLNKGLDAFRNALLAHLTANAKISKIPNANTTSSSSTPSPNPSPSLPNSDFHRHHWLLSYRHKLSSYSLPQLVQESIRFHFQCAPWVILSPSWHALREALWKHLDDIGYKKAKRSVKTKENLIELCVMEGIKYDFSAFVKDGMSHGNKKKKMKMKKEGKKGIEAEKEKEEDGVMSLSSSSSSPSPSVNSSPSCSTSPSTSSLLPPSPSSLLLPLPTLPSLPSSQLAIMLDCGPSLPRLHQAFPSFSPDIIREMFLFNERVKGMEKEGKENHMEDGDEEFENDHQKTEMYVENEEKVDEGEATNDRDEEDDNDPNDHDHDDVEEDAQDDEEESDEEEEQDMESNEGHLDGSHRREALMQ